MSVSVSVNSVSYTIPQTGETNWGDQVTAWIQAVSSGTLQKNGGSFALTADADFGANFGIKLAYIKSQTANLASTGFLRLANSDQISFRNAGNTADIALKPGSTDNFIQYAGIDLVNISTAQTLINKTLAVGSNSITGSTAKAAQFNASTGNLEASAVTNTELGYLSGVTSSVQTQLNAKEPSLVAGTTAQYYRGDKSWQTLNTSVVPESSNLYYTDTRARLSISASSPISYNSTTGALSLSSSGVSAGSYTTANITVDSFGRVTAASNGVGSSSDTDLFVLNGGVTLVDDFDGPAYATGAKTITKIVCSLYNSGSSGSTVITFKYGPALASSTTVTITANGGLAAASTTPSISLSSGDYLSASVTQVADGLVEDLRCKVYY